MRDSKAHGYAAEYLDSRFLDANHWLQEAERCKPIPSDDKDIVISTSCSDFSQRRKRVSAHREAFYVISMAIGKVYPYLSSICVLATVICSSRTGGSLLHLCDHDQNVLLAGGGCHESCDFPRFTI